MPTTTAHSSLPQSRETSTYLIEVQLETVPKTWRQFWAAVGPYETGINRAERRAHVHVLWTAYKNGTPVHEITTPTGVEIED